VKIILSKFSTWIGNKGKFRCEKGLMKIVKANTRCGCFCQAM